MYRIVMLLASMMLMIVISGYSQDEEQFTITVEDLSWLEGTWKVEDSESYEEWMVGDEEELKGVGYRMIEGEMQVIETLRIAMDEGWLIYFATVPSQNDGSTIPFVCTGFHNEDIVFENRNHDFPSKIQYTLLNPNRVLIRLYKIQEGFFLQTAAYYLIRQ